MGRTSNEMRTTTKSCLKCKSISYLNLYVTLYITVFIAISVKKASRGHCGYLYRSFSILDRTHFNVNIISCRLLDQKVDMPQCKLAINIDLEPIF